MGYKYLTGIDYSHFKTHKSFFVGENIHVLCAVSGGISLIVMLVEAHIPDSIASIASIANIGTLIAVPGRGTESSISRKDSLLARGPGVSKVALIFCTLCVQIV